MFSPERTKEERKEEEPKKGMKKKETYFARIVITDDDIPWIQVTNDDVLRVERERRVEERLKA
jgi:hypothetical protein